MFYVDSNKCNGCEACVDVCPQRAISVQNGMAVIDQRLCRQCGNCAEICPADAIRTTVPVYAQSMKGGYEMRGRGWSGWGYWGWGRGRGRGNPYPFCYFYPWLPRRWWAYGPGPYPQTIPAYYPAYRFPQWW